MDGNAGGDAGPLASSSFFVVELFKIMDPPILVLLQFCVRSTLGDKLKHPRSQKGQEKDGNSFFVQRIRGGMHGMRPRKKKINHQPTSLPNKREKKHRTNCPGKLVHLWKGSLFGDFNAVVVAFFATHF